MSVSNKRKRSRAYLFRRFMDTIQKDTKVVGVNEEDAIDRENGGK